jgi:hypothetical protein
MQFDHDFYHAVLIIVGTLIVQVARNLILGLQVM